MPIIEIEKKEGLVIAVWKIEETEEQLLTTVDERIFDAMQMQKIRHPQKRREWLASRVLLTEILNKEKIPYNRFKKDEFGKPYLENCIYHLSITHSHTYCAIILSTNPFLGIDIEANFEKTHLIRSKYMNEKELTLCGKDTQISALIWSAKEAMYKAYAKKRLIFKEDMEVVVIHDHQIEGKLNKIGRDILLAYVQNPEYVLTYVIG